MLYAQAHLTLPAWIHGEVDIARTYDDDEAKVALAIQLSNRNVEQGSGGPFGAAVFDGHGRLIAVGVNRVVPQIIIVQPQGAAPAAAPTVIYAPAPAPAAAPEKAAQPAAKPTGQE